MVDHLLGRYGGLVDEVLALIDRRPDLGQPLEGAEHYLRGRGAVRRHARGCAAPRRRARPAHPRLDRDLRPRHHRRPPGGRADGRGAGLGHAQLEDEIDHYLRRVEAERQSQLKLTDQEADEARVKAVDIV